MGQDAAESDVEFHADPGRRRWQSLRLRIVGIRVILGSLWILLLVLAVVSVAEWIKYKKNFMHKDHIVRHPTLVAAVDRPLTFICHFTATTVGTILVLWSAYVCTWRWTRPRTQDGKSYCVAALSFSALMAGTMAIVVAGTLFKIAAPGSARWESWQSETNAASKSLASLWAALGGTFILMFLLLILLQSVVKRVLFGDTDRSNTDTVDASASTGQGKAGMDHAKEPGIPHRKEAERGFVSKPEQSKKLPLNEAESAHVMANGIWPAVTAAAMERSAEPTPNSDVVVQVHEGAAEARQHASVKSDERVTHPPQPSIQGPHGITASGSTIASAASNVKSQVAVVSTSPRTTGGPVNGDAAPEDPSLDASTVDPNLVTTATMASTTVGSDIDAGRATPQPSLRAATQTFTDVTQIDWTEFKRAAGDADGPLDQLEVALDGMFCMQAPFYYRYNVLSAVERRVGGQGLVQFASISNTQEKAAIKFYLDKSAFERERELYTESQLRTMMPATLAIDDNSSGTCSTPYGYSFPPFVIIEYGQSLDEWARRNNADFITIFQSLSHAVRALARLHSFGYAHRDIKPGNILRRPNQHDWTLIDFGCTAQIGTISALCYSLRYAAPEVVRALEAGRKTIKVDPALDIWAIGVIAFELLTGERAFNDATLGPEDAERAIKDAIAGRTSLPWEGATAASRLEKLRGLKRTVLRCLDRDPARRPSAEALLKSWDHTFDNMQTHGTFLTRTAT